MNNFAFYSPTEFVFGKGTESQTAELVKKYTLIPQHYYKIFFLST